ncbi:hypothetical protein CONPUDRAFT_159219 [Coniophora puteana RWD-64-598 SS2]|uniref:Uncharacterized protein n=1 Tax=Coniophora puteana (strain RWD-64-598) TaxID=741705 RepID=A0A5M3M6V5_CONPW|nr:uncharacterized protein CONPUDRAFT_159219 [Coniophora puteana RWD-64-598 SS2]EIW75082.1 hypothetical protein CONPUDRAFT_159219 [Coniophora puteana RWD-64-598 SS2]
MSHLSYAFQHQFIPQKLHTFLHPEVRKVYLDTSTSDQLRHRVKELEARVQSLSRDKEQLMQRCEAYMASSAEHAEGEKRARKEARDAKKKLAKYRKSTAQAETANASVAAGPASTSAASEKTEKLSESDPSFLFDSDGEDEGLFGPPPRKRLRNQSQNQQRPRSDS